MSTRTGRLRRMAVAVAGLAAACAVAAPAAAAHAAGGYTPNPHQWYFGKWHIQDQVWPVSQGVGVTVAVVDTGVQASNPDLRGVVKPGADMLGYLGGGERDYGPGGGHGTEVAELIAGQGIGIGPAGVAPQAKILPVHVINPSTESAPIAKGIRYATDHGAQVINLSVGGIVPSPTSCDPAEQRAIAYALAHNVVVVAASGDANKMGPGPEGPGTCAGVLTVGGVEQDGSVWRYSTQGPQVSVAAPGDHLYVSSIDGQQQSVDSPGTSFSTALVSGAAALIRSKYPSMPWYTVDQRLIGTAIHTGSVPNDGTGYGIVDIAKAIDVAHDPVPASTPNPPYARYQAYLKSTGQSGSAPGGQAAPSSGKSSSGTSSALLIVGLVVVALIIIAVVLIIALVSRNRSRQGPHNPGGPRSPGGPYNPGGGYPPNGPPGQYPPAGQQYPPAQPGQYPPPGGPQYPQGQGQYPPPRQ